MVVRGVAGESVSEVADVHTVLSISHKGTDAYDSVIIRHPLALFDLLCIECLLPSDAEQKAKTRATNDGKKGLV